MQYVSHVMTSMCIVNKTSFFPAPLAYHPTTSGMIMSELISPYAIIWCSGVHYSMKLAEQTKVFPETAFVLGNIGKLVTTITSSILLSASQILNKRQNKSCYLQYCQRSRRVVLMFATSLSLLNFHPIPT